MQVASRCSSFGLFCMVPSFACFAVVDKSFLLEHSYTDSGPKDDGDTPVYPPTPFPPSTATTQQNQQWTV